jgi:hypothetical protein
MVFRLYLLGQQGFPEGLTNANKLNFAPRFGISHNLHQHGIVLHAAFGIFFTPVDMNTWCNQSGGLRQCAAKIQSTFDPPRQLHVRKEPQRRSGFSFTDI